MISAVELLMDKYAENITLMSSGKPVLHPIDDKTINTMIKIVKETGSFEQFEKIVNPEVLTRVADTEKKTIPNIYEHVIKEVKNGRPKV